MPTAPARVARVLVSEMRGHVISQAPTGGNRPPAIPIPREEQGHRPRSAKLSAVIWI